MEARVTTLGAGGAIGFTPNKFTEPPVVVCSIMRLDSYVSASRPVNIFVTSVTKDSFSYTVKGDRKPFDQISWIAIGS